jgi:hypothetical protein
MREELATVEGLVSQTQDQRSAIEEALAALEMLEQPGERREERPLAR